MVKIFTTPTCVYCKEAEALFKLYKVKYTKLDVSENVLALAEMVDLTGQMGVPVIDFHGKIFPHFNRAKLIRAMEDAGYKHE